MNSKNPGDRVDNSGSKVSERVAFLSGKHVQVRVAYSEIGQVGGEQFTALFRDVVPLGREYFFVFLVAGRQRLCRCSSVIEVAEQ